MRKVLCNSKKKLNKKGFTLIELLVCVAIMAVLALTLAQFVGTSTNAYRRASSQTKIQETSQDTLTKIANIVRNSKNLVVTKMSNGGIKMESVNYENNNILLIYVPNTDEKTNFGKIYVDYDYIIPEADPDDPTAKPVLVDITHIEEGEKYNEYLIAENVKEFKVDFATYKTKDEKGMEITAVQKRTLDMSLTLERSGRSYTQNFKASLRNSSPEGQTTELVIEIKNQ